MIKITRNVWGTGRNSQRMYDKEIASGQVAGVIESLTETTICIRVSDSETYDITFCGKDTLLLNNGETKS